MSSIDFKSDTYFYRRSGRESKFPSCIFVVKFQCDKHQIRDQSEACLLRLFLQISDVAQGNLTIIKALSLKVLIHTGQIESERVESGQLSLIEALRFTLGLFDLDLLIDDQFFFCRGQPKSLTFNVLKIESGKNKESPLSDCEFCCQVCSCVLCFVQLSSLTVLFAVRK